MYPNRSVNRIPYTAVLAASLSTHLWPSGRVGPLRLVKITYSTNGANYTCTAFQCTPYMFALIDEYIY